MKTHELAAIGRLAVEEHAQWVARNEARDAIKRRLRQLGIGRHDLSKDDWEADEWAEWQAMLEAEKKSQVRLNTRRCATRRAIARVAASSAQRAQEGR